MTRLLCRLLPIQDKSNRVLTASDAECLLCRERYQVLRLHTNDLLGVRFEHFSQVGRHLDLGDARAGVSIVQSYVTWACRLTLLLNA